MLEWGAPLWFLLIPVAVLLPWWFRDPRILYSDVLSISVRPTWRVLLGWLPGALGSVALIGMVVAMARPQFIDRERVVERQGIDILLVLDISGSMEAEDFNIGGRDATRLTVAKQVITEFVAGRPDDRIGLVVFGEEAFTQVPLTLDHDALVDFLRQVDIGMAGRRATAIGDAIVVAGKRLREVEAEDQVMILLTDGRSNTGTITPMDAAEAADALGIRIHTIGVGTTGRRRGFLGVLGGAGNELDERTLKAIAKITDAHYFRATDTQGLQEVYATIDALEKSTAEVREFVHREERYHGVLGWALLLLAIRLLLGETVLRRLP